MKPEIIFEDEHLLVLDKPAGLLVHPTARSREATVVDWLRENYPQLAGVGENLRLASGETLDRYGLVHRLDRETSGLLLVAKTPATFAWLKNLFQTRQIEKTYRAIVHGAVAESEGVIDAPIGRSRRDPRVRAAGPAAKGERKTAITFYRRLARTPDYSYLAVKPRTGRTHQIRVHLKSIGHPVLGDVWYAPKKKGPPRLAEGEAGPTILGRLALHAFSLEFSTERGERLRLEAAPPADFAAALAGLGLVC